MLRALLSPFHNTRLLSPFLLNSVPKSGTNLLSKAIALFPGTKEKHISFLPPDVRRRYGALSEQEPLVSIGVGADRWLGRTAVQQYLHQLERGDYLRGHVPHSPEMVTLLDASEMKSVLILRDPRDVVISHVNYVVQNPRHRLRDKYMPLSEAERIMLTIRGFPQSEPDGPLLLSIGDRFRLFSGWLNEPTTYVTYFEKLVGPQGGGTAEAQRTELERIARHLGIWHSEKQLLTVAEQLFGGTNTFRKGTVGGWQTHFHDQHRQAFKDVAGQLLLDLGYEEDSEW